MSDPLSTPTPSLIEPDRPRRSRAARRRAFGSVHTLPNRRGFYITVRWKRHRMTRLGGLTRPDASKKVAAIEALLKGGVSWDEMLCEVFGDPRGTKMSFRECVGPYFEYAAARKKASTLAADRTRMAAIVRAPWTALRLAEIGPDVLTRWATERMKPRVVVVKRPCRRRRSGPDASGTPQNLIASPKRRKVHPVRREIRTSGPTINRDLALVSALFRWAVRMGHVETNPVRRVERFSERGRERVTYLVAEEVRALLDASSSVLRPVVLVATHTGMRRGELLALRWRDVDLARKEILIAPANAKSGRARTIPLSGDAVGALSALKASRPTPSLHGSDHVFRGRTGGRLTGRVLYSAFDSTVARCEGIPLEKRALVTFHTLRHTAASLMVGAGASIYEVRKILGHGSLRMTERYAHFAPDAGRNAVDRLGQALAFPATPTARAQA